ncbi:MULTISPECIES: GTP pyrophosphokinase [Xanthomonas]|uniref:GTP pyrophosphokinase n=1 Tax=Xanthomonas TaxID=338 RepID=UPI001427DDD4|nr:MULTISPECIES: RelA/SpoT domain-containing protein [Xanthomonas]
MGTTLEEHGEAAASDYRKVRSTYEDLAETVQTVLAQAFKAHGLRVHSVESRAKAVDSFEAKASKGSEEDPEKPKYQKPLDEIHDKTGARVITFLPRDVEAACAVISKEFQVLERADKSEALIDEGKFGYQSIHFLVSLSPARTTLAEYSRFNGLVFEIQVRTILQHAWAEMEHDIQYKSSYTIPRAIKKRFIALAGMLEIADREFQRLQDDDEELRRDAQAQVAFGNYEVVEITADALKAYLDKRLGADGRMNQFSYEMAARHARQLGFTNLKQIESCTAGLDDDAISRILWGGRQGQLTRFDGLLMAGMGDLYTQRHPWAKHDFWADRFHMFVERLRSKGMVRGYDPQGHGQVADLEQG